MVDLVKIRKKAKKKEEAAADAAATGEGASPGVESAAPAVTSVSDAPDPGVAPAPSPVSPPEPEAKVQERPKSTAEGGGATPGPPTAPGATSKLERFKESAGKRREQIEEAAADETTEAGQLELLTFVIAGESYAVDIEHILEIVTPRTLTRIPNADPSIVGIMSLRGTIVTLVDVRRKLRHTATAAETADTRIVVVDLYGEILGFAVDRVNRVIKTTMAAIEPHPVVHVSEQDVAIRGVFRAGNALTILLDLDKLLDSRALAAPLAPLP